MKMINYRRTAVLAGLLALTAASMIGQPAQAKLPPQPFDGPGFQSTAAGSFLDRLHFHQQAEELLRHRGFINFAPGRWALDGHEVDLPPTQQLTLAAFRAFAERGETILDTVRRERAQARNPARGGEDYAEGGEKLMSAPHHSWRGWIAGQLAGDPGMAV